MAMICLLESNVTKPYRDSPVTCRANRELLIDEARSARRGNQRGKKRMGKNADGLERKYDDEG